MFFVEIKDIKDEIFVKIKDIKEFTSHIYSIFLYLSKISGLILDSLHLFSLNFLLYMLILYHGGHSRFTIFVKVSRF